jgi:hypothetical protein
MNKTSGTSKDAADKLVRGIKRKTRKLTSKPSVATAKQGSLPPLAAQHQDVRTGSTADGFLWLLAMSVVPPKAAYFQRGLGGPLSAINCH